MNADPRCPTHIPDEPDFSPADVAALLSVDTANVDYWMKSGKLHKRENFRGNPRIDRDELVRFCREYLHCRIDL